MKFSFNQLIYLMSSIIPYFNLSDDAQRAIAAFQVIQYIRSISPDQDSLHQTHAHTFQQELITQRIIDPLVVSHQNVRNVLDIFTLSHNLDPNIPLLNFRTKNTNIQDSKSNKCLSYSYYPTQTTKAIFNILLNMQRQSIVTGGYGLSKNIAIYLLWHLSNFITCFRTKEDIKIIAPYVDLQQFGDVPKFIYYKLEEEGEEQVIQQLREQCQDIGLSENKSDLRIFCREITEKYRIKETHVFFIIISAYISPQLILEKLKQIEIKGQQKVQIGYQLRKRLMSLSNVQMIFSKDAFRFSAPQLILRQIRGNAYQNKYLQTFFSTDKLEFQAPIHKYNLEKDFCQNSNRLISYQRIYFLICKRKFAMKGSSNCKEWQIGDIRQIYKELSVAMHDDLQFYSTYEQEFEIMDILTQQQAENFTLLQSQYINRTLQQTIDKDQNCIQLWIQDNSKFDFQTYCVNTNEAFILENLRRYFSFVIFNKKQFLYAFYGTMARLMASYPQQFTLQMNGQSFRIKAQARSTFLPITQSHNRVHLDTHIGDLKLRVLNLRRPSYYLSAITSSKHHSTQKECFDCAWLRWDQQRNQYDFKSIEWAFETQIYHYWLEKNSSFEIFFTKNYKQSQCRAMPRINRAIRAQRQIEANIGLRRQHFIVCPRSIVEAVKEREDLTARLQNASNKWKITLIAIEDLRFSDFTYHDENLLCSVNQLLEYFTIPKVCSN